MAAQTEARDEARRHATEDASVVLAKHPCVTPGAGECGEERVGPAEGDRARVGYEGEDVGGGEHAAGAGSS